MESWSEVNFPAATIEVSGMEKTMRYIANGTMKKRISLSPAEMPRLKPASSFFAKLSDSSVNMAVVMGTVRIAYGRVYQRRA